MFSILADASADQLSAQMVAFMSAAFGTIMLIAIGIAVLTVWLFWRIFAKAGFNGALGLLCLIPSFGILICIVILAFSDWPSQRVAASVGSMPMST